MPNLTAVLRHEIVRLARRALRVEYGALRSQSARHRRNLASMKREITALRRELTVVKRERIPNRDPEPTTAKVRFSPKSVAAQQRRLGLSATEFGQLLGVSDQTVYNWIKGVRPRPPQIAMLKQLQGVGKREARSRLEAALLEATPARATAKRSRRRDRKR